jgi:hypothetical protein
MSICGLTKLRKCGLQNITQQGKDVTDATVFYAATGFL